MERNTRLEEAYFAAGTDVLPDPVLDADRDRLLVEGCALAGAIEDVPADVASSYELLGMVGLVLAACRRHERDDPVRMAPVWAVSQRLGEACGVAPRLVFSHLAFHHGARDGVPRAFTSLPDEACFTELNAVAVLGYDRAAATLAQIGAVGVTSPVATVLLDEAHRALADVLAANRRLAASVSVDRFFRNIRPYFKPYRVGATVLRGINAGDFAAPNEIDVLLGLADAADPFYAGVVAEKAPFVPPGQRARLDALPTLPSLLEGCARRADGTLPPNAERYLDVCTAHGAAYAFHHTALVKPFLVRPAASAPPDRAAQLSSSGPPLEVVVATLDRLRALRTSRAPHEALGVARRRVASTT